MEERLRWSCSAKYQSPTVGSEARLKMALYSRSQSFNYTSFRIFTCGLFGGNVSRKNSEQLCVCSAKLLKNSTDWIVLFARLMMLRALCMFSVLAVNNTFGATRSEDCFPSPVPFPFPSSLALCCLKALKKIGQQDDSASRDHACVLPRCVLSPCINLLSMDLRTESSTGRSPHKNFSRPS